jgi:hypothetical protein
MGFLGSRPGRSRRCDTRAAGRSSCYGRHASSRCCGSLDRRAAATRPLLTVEKCQARLTRHRARRRIAVSTLGIAAVATLIITGLSTHGSWWACFGTRRISIWTLAAAENRDFLILVAVAAVNRMQLTPRLAVNSAGSLREHDAVRQLKRKLSCRDAPGLNLDHRRCSGDDFGYDLPGDFISRSACERALCRTRSFGSFGRRGPRLQGSPPPRDAVSR